MASCRAVLLNERPGIEGIPKAENFEVKDSEEDVTLSNGQVLVKTLYLSVDPYMRCRMNPETGIDYLGPWKIGSPCEGGGIGVILKSRFDGLVENDMVESFMWPWKTTAKMEGSVLQKVEDQAIKSHPSLALGVLGMTGHTAYFGIKKKAFISPSKNQTVVVSGAAGACGSIAGQIARLEGAANVVGICGTKVKCNHLKDDLGFNAAINYKIDDIEESLKRYCPNGIDVYFDNVGGEISDCIIRNMNANSHIVLCGQIAVYNQDLPYPPPLSEEISKIVEENKITRERFLVLNYQSELKESLKQLICWVEEGKLKFEETVTEGIENIGKAFISVMTGGNIGKQVVKVSEM